MSYPSEPREKSLAFCRVPEEPLPLLRKEDAALLLYLRPLSGDVDNATPLLLIGFLAGASVVLGLLQRLEGFEDGPLLRPP
jgi:hypothetical protein